MIRPLLANIVLNSVGLTMGHGDDAWNNLRADNGTTDLVLLVDPIKFNITNLTFLKESYPVIMLFLRKSELDNTPEQLATITEVPRNYVRAFIAGCRDESRIDSITSINSVEVLHLFDSDYSGWMLYCSITPANSGTPC